MFNSARERGIATMSPPGFNWQSLTHITPTSARQTDKLMYKHIMKHLDSEKILNDNQGGFRKGFSTMKTKSNQRNDIL